jgi:nicotinamide mononucleotide transporter
LLWSHFYLAGQTRAAWPLLDSLTTFGSLVATWLMAQVKLENWFYWIVLDAISVFLFATQGLMLVALLFAAYLVLSAIGFFTWLKTWRSPVQQT